jgi:integrase/recombinase XerD
MLELQAILGHVSILTTAKYTHLTTTSQQHSGRKIDALMNGFDITWGNIR